MVAHTVSVANEPLQLPLMPQQVAPDETTSREAAASAQADAIAPTTNALSGDNGLPTRVLASSQAKKCRLWSDDMSCSTQLIHQDMQHGPKFDPLRRRRCREVCSYCEQHQCRQHDGHPGEYHDCGCSNHKASNALGELADGTEDSKCESHIAPECIYPGSTEGSKSESPSNARDEIAIGTADSKCESLKAPECIYPGSAEDSKCESHIAPECIYPGSPEDSECESLNAPEKAVVRSRGPRIDPANLPPSDEMQRCMFILRAIPMQAI